MNYDAATLEMLYERREEHLNGSTESYTVEEAIAFVRNTSNKADGTKMNLSCHKMKVNVTKMKLTGSKM